MDRDPGDQRRASLRAADADREQFVAALRQHHADGRLTTEELAERTERAYAARTFGDLDALAADLPPLPPPAPGPPAAGAPAPADLPRRMRPPGPRQAAAKAALLRTILWFGTLSLVLIVVWAMSGRNYFWPVWPILGFTLAIVWQAFAVWGPRPSEDRDPRGPDRR
jgi:uncharacterized protein DUF1707/2TM domain-containing protein